MVQEVIRYVVLITLIVATAGCEALTGPKRTGEIQLSSEFFGSDSFYQYGYSYENSEYYRFPYQGEPIPDIINETYRVVGSEIVLVAGFNTPGRMNGFALVGEFESLSDAKTFYQDYSAVGNDLQFEAKSDTVEQFQVWIQLTELGNYVKLLVKDIENLADETGTMYNEVNMEYTYQPNGSTTFPD
ncbi:MAG: hypothetical protein KAT15_12610 [Bacteroidales bacterium]|nr:hypothetical protein [Bacteroidales bacterium]